MLNTRTTQVLNTALVAKIVRNWHGCPYSGDKPWGGGGGGGWRYGATPGKSRERCALY